MTPTYAIPARRRAVVPVGFQLLIALGLPMIGAITVGGIYLNKEAIVAAAWVAMVIVGMVFVDPLIGIVAMSGGFLLAAYPTVLQTLGVLTISNLLGVCLAVLLVSHVLSTRDLSFLTVRQVLLLTAIGIVMMLSVMHSDVIFPTLGYSHALGVKEKVLDKTSDMVHDYWTRLIFFVFLCAFIRSRRSLKAMYGTFVLVLFLAVPSALVNWWQGNLSHGFRAVASFTVGANANRLAMICLMEAACWWCWFHARRSFARGAIAGSAVGAAMLVVLATGSRSGLLGALVLGALLQTGLRQYRVPLPYIAAVLIAGSIAVATVVPPEAWQRALTYSSDKYELGGTSVEKRTDTIWTGLKMVQDHPFLGIGLGNFREVSRQIYLDPFFRPPHNSYLWAATEGGLIVLAGYCLLFWLTWLDLRRVQQLAYRDPDIVHIAVALRVVFLLYCYFAGFADLWLNPITYVLIGMILSFRRHLESLPAVPVRTALVAVR